MNEAGVVSISLCLGRGSGNRRHHRWSSRNCENLRNWSSGSLAANSMLVKTISSEKNAGNEEK